MTPLRFLHIADAHLDTPFYGREEWLRRKLRDACRQAFRSAAELAIERKVHAVLIAGDLFDNDILSFTTERFLPEAMAELREAGIPVFYATGNHDPGRKNYRARQIPWPENVCLFTGSQPETVKISDAQGNQLAWLTGAGHIGSHDSTNLAERFDQARSDLPHVALLHAYVVSARGASEHDSYAPCSRQDLERGAFDYWALGHIHLRQQVFPEVPAWYPGNIQGRNPKETGPKGALLVTIEKGSAPQTEFVPLAPIVWDFVQLPCPPEEQSFDSLTNELAKLIHPKLNLEDDAEHLVRVDLTGQSRIAPDLNAPDNLQELAENLQETLGVTWLEVRPRNIVNPVNIAEYHGTQTVLGTTLQVIDEARQSDELLSTLRPTELANQHLENVPAYLRSLLSGMESDAASRLLFGEEQ